MLWRQKAQTFSICVVAFSLLIVYDALTSDEIDNDGFDEHHDEHSQHNIDRIDSGPLPKDKVLLRDLKKLILQRNKRTTSRRTHSIHQLSCVGGTAGCKLFTVDVSNSRQCR